MQSLKEKIEKLLRLAMSPNPHEASAALAKATELMEKYAISREDLEKTPFITQTIEINYTRMPRWLGTLYSNIAHINGCYLVWRDGQKAKGIKAQVIITGIESDLENIVYYVEVVRQEIESKVKELKKSRTLKREALGNYRMGLADGIYTALYRASQTFNKGVSANALVVLFDERYELAKTHYLQNNKVKVLLSNFINGLYYAKGQIDAMKISLKRPLSSQENNTQNNT